MLQRPLIGRSSEITLARELLLDIGVSWLTLTGTGGVGKTHLALSLANQIADEYELAAFVPLAALDDPELVLPSIAHSLGLAEPSERALSAYLDGFDGPKRLLLVIDNCEHVAAGFEVAGRLLTSSPGVQVVATSRSPLHLAALLASRRRDSLVLRDGRRTIAIPYDEVIWFETEDYYTRVHARRGTGSSPSSACGRTTPPAR